MKLLKFGETRREKPGVQLENGKHIDILDFGFVYNETFSLKMDFQNIKHGFKVMKTNVGKSRRMLD